ncbi:MAG: hypothetical protein H6713_17790 [Myxococcales bacterium]|nr:hypothetical protein [Myxococcales bacterium]
MPTHALTAALTAAALSSLLALAPGASALRPPHGPPPGPPPHIVLAHLNETGALELDAATLRAAEQRATSRRAALTQLHEARRAATDAYFSALTQAAQDAPTARQTAAAAEAALRVAELELAREIHGLLTPAQREQLAALRPPPPPPPDTARLGARARELGVDDLTADAIVDVFQHHARALAALHRSVHAAHDDYLALAGLAASSERVTGQRARVTASVTRLRAAELVVLVELRSLLTESQWSALAPALRGPPPPPHPHHDGPPPRPPGDPR